ALRVLKWLIGLQKIAFRNQDFPERDLFRFTVFEFGIHFDPSAFHIVVHGGAHHRKYFLGGLLTDLPIEILSIRDSVSNPPPILGQLSSVVFVSQQVLRINEKETKRCNEWTTCHDLRPLLLMSHSAPR